ncbi:3-isopropylmalate dehydratase small subunit [Compostimonas suwonensis]|uniref:3-isopropylmalate dehydratase small subunit n=1 Tax=Compostimonas suwonensis TaxID=1048394 RepID=UPI000C23BB03|nr:3-isopropylmalate dehydratase small subunit [Compostimonas suwonensis]
MEPFVSHTGIAVPLRRSNVDTDQVISAKFLKRITRDGYEDALFASWREDPSFVLNQEPYRAGSVLVAGSDFGIGSSREQAVWALQNYGFRVVISSKFGDIFRSNSGKAGLVAALVADDDVELLMSAAEAEPGIRFRVDLESRSIRVGECDEAPVVSFDIPDHTRYRLLNGLDEVAVTLQNEAEIAAFESRRPTLKPVVP